MGGPDKIPAGSWGGQLDPNYANERARFEAGLAVQQQRIADMRNAAPAKGVTVIDQMPEPGPPRADGFAIPAAGREGTDGADMIGAMGADQERAHRDAARAAAASGEGPPVLEQAPPARGQPNTPKGHIPASLAAQLPPEPEPARRTAGPLMPPYDRVASDNRALSPAPSKLRQARQAQSATLSDPQQALAAMDLLRLMCDRGELTFDEKAAALAIAGELVFSISERLRGIE